MLFVLIYWGRCGLGDGEEMSLLWRGWLVVGVVERVVGGWRCGEGGWWLALCGWSKITIAKEKYYLKITALLHRFRSIITEK